MASGDAGPPAESAEVGALPFPDMSRNVTQQLGADRAHNLLRIEGSRIDRVSGATSEKRDECYNAKEALIGSDNDFCND